MKIPHWCDTPELRKQWEQPWLGSSRKFRRRLRKHGHLSPHFTISEAASHADGCGCKYDTGGIFVIRRLQALCFRLERVRHRLGDHPLHWLDAYRNTCHNPCVGGAGASEHMTGRACDPLKPDAVSWADFNKVMEQEFQHGGIGRGCVTGNVQHVDTGPERRWCYPGR